jgi:HEPN domain-containing protein
MKPLTREWVAKAEGDFASARRELRARRDPNYDSACFHAQQCAEKYLKARLQEAGVAFDRTHDLALLLDRLVTLEPEWELFRPDMRRLTTYAVAFRYPGSSATKDLAREACGHCVRVRAAVRARLGLEVSRRPVSTSTPRARGTERKTRGRGRQR